MGALHHSDRAAQGGATCWPSLALCPMRPCPPISTKPRSRASLPRPYCHAHGAWQRPMRMTGQAPARCCCIGYHGRLPGATHPWQARNCRGGVRLLSGNLHCPDVRHRGDVRAVALRSSPNVTLQRAVVNETTVKLQEPVEDEEVAGPISRPGTNGTARRAPMPYRAPAGAFIPVDPGVSHSRH